MDGNYNNTFSTVKYDMIICLIIISFLEIAAIYQDNFLSHIIVIPIVTIFMFKNIEVSLLIFPLICLIKEGFLIIPGVTVIRLVGIIFVIFYILKILFKKLKIVFNSTVIIFFMFVILLVSNLLFASIFNFSEILISELNITEIFGRIFLVIFVIFIYQFLSQFSYEKMNNFLIKLGYAISFGLIIISLFNIFVNTKMICQVLGIRYVRVYALRSDPNDFGIIIGALLVFPLYMLFNVKNPFIKCILFFSICISFFSVFNSMSKMGIIVSNFSFLIYFILIEKSYKNKFKILTVGVLIMLILFNFINFSAIEYRFIYKNITDFTSNRSLLWIGAVSAILEKPIFGYGAATYVHKYYLSRVTGLDLTVHNLFLQFLLEYGLIGLILFFLLIYRTFFIIKINKLLSNKLFILPFVSLCALLFGGMSLTWAFKDIIWYFIVLSLAVNDVVKREYNKTERKKYKF